MKNNKWIILLLILIPIVAYGVKAYNNLVGAEEAVKQRWSQVENQYQRRMDLIPNLVQTVKGYASHEQKTLEGVIEARSKATQTTINLDNIDEAQFAAFQARQGELSSALSRLMAVVERYPDLKANKNFEELQKQLEGTENRISTERLKYTEAVEGYNVMVRRFPAALFAKLFGFKVYPTFKAETGAERAPEVSFD